MANPVPASRVFRADFARHPTVHGRAVADRQDYITIAAVGLSFVLSLWALIATAGAHGPLEYPVHSWIKAGEFDFAVGILMDPLTAVMLVVVTGVSLMVQIYSVGYMHGDAGYARYYAYMSLFTCAMLGLVLANNLIQISSSGNWWDSAPTFS